MTLGLVMIVKNESERIEACLDAVKPYVDSYTIVDTGSTDDTIQKIDSVLGDKVTIWYERFVNFGVSRSFALHVAKDTADWLLCLDADMIAHWNPEWTPFTESNIEAYLLETSTDSSWSNRLPLLIRGNIAWKSVGAVHEYLAKMDDSPIITKVADFITIQTENRSTPEKQQWYAKMLEEELVDTSHPLSPRSLFYLAKTYQELGDSRALSVYRRRTALLPGAEETYNALVRQGQLEEWPHCIVAWMRANEMRPWRLEARYHLARVLREHELYGTAYLWASMNLNEPNPDSVFVDTWIWDYGMKFERSISASRLGYHEEALRLCDELLKDKRLPDNIREAVIRNWVFSV